MNNTKQKDAGLRSSNSKEAIAIVGMGLRYPGDVNSPEAFWDFVLSKKDGFCDVPESRWNLERFQDNSDKIEGKSRNKQAAFISDEEMQHFDAPFFNLSPREAEGIDPQQRLLLRCSWEALENANIPPSSWSGKTIGIYVGGFTADNLLMQNSSENFSMINQSSASSSTLVMLSNRVSYFFDFKGPSITIDTACSSSLVALNYACNDIWNNNADAALVGGVNAMLYPGFNVTMSKGGFLSPDSRSKTFDRDANGYARGEGAGVVVIKPLSKALEDGDKIYALINSTGVNQDGRTAGISLPNGDSQSALIKKVIEDGNISIDDIVMVEAHGTGTVVGDPTEINALNEVLTEREDGQPRYITSVKGNIGHQEAGAGIAGVIKTALSLYHDQIPPQANLENLNPGLDLEKGLFKVPLEPRPLAKQSNPKLACINSFGYGGTNAHAVLSSYDEPAQASADRSENSANLLLFSAQTPDAVSAQIETTLTYLSKNKKANVADIARTLACGRDQMDYRLPVQIGVAEETTKTLTQILEQIVDGSLQPLAKPAQGKQGITFLYTGMGPQWWAMGHELFKNNSVFCDAVLEADLAFCQHSGWPIKEKMFDADESTSEMPSNIIAQPANFVIQHAITCVLKSWGIEPQAIIGHSVGEVSAALAAGCLTLDQAAEVAYHRSRLQQQKAGKGRMLATGMDLETAKSVVSLYEDGLSIGAINSPTSIALSGSEPLLRNVMEELEPAGVFNKLIFGEVAYHSHQMDDLKEELLTSLSHLKPAAPTLPLYSTAYGRKITGAEHDAAYWWANVRQPVLFQDALTAMANDGFTSFVEVGPNPVLAGAIAQVFAGLESSDAKTYSTLSRKKPEQRQLLNLVGDLWSNDLIEDLSSLFDGNKIQLPCYPWQGERLWREAESSRVFRIAQKATPLLGFKTSDAVDTWENTIDSNTLTSLYGHIIDGSAIFPGAGYVEAFVGAVNELHPNQNFGLSDIQFEMLLPLPEGSSLQTRVSCVEDTLTFHARNLNQDGEWRKYATAKVVQQGKTSYARTPEKFAEPTTYSHQTAYEKLDLMGLNYEGDYRPIANAHVSTSKAHATLQLKAGAWDDDRLITHPAMIDGGLQLLALMFPDISSSPVPTKIGQLNVFGKLSGGKLKVEATLHSDFTATLAYFKEDDTVFAELHNVEMLQIPNQNMAEDQSLQYAFTWEEAGLSDDGSQGQLTIARLMASPSLEKEIGLGNSDGAPLHVFLSEAGLKPDVEEAFKLIEFVRSIPLDERAVVLTRGAWALNANDHINPAQAALWGIYRTARHELQKLNIAALDLPSDFSNWKGLNTLIEKLPPQGEFGMRDGEFFQRKLVHTTDQSKTTSRLVQNRESISAVLTGGERGGLSALHYEGEWRRPPNDDEVEFKLEYAAINFKDVLKVLNKLTDQTLKGTFFQRSLGMEGSAVVSRAGKNTDFKIGERVALGSRFGTFQSYITVKPEDAFILRWGDLPFSSAELATLPIGYASAFYGLKKLAQLEEGETVLLHSASGAVGHAAIHVAQECGANIIATAGTEEKRQYLRDMGIEHVFNSRNLDFEHDVLNVTRNEGVDVILNFLPGDLLHANLRVLKSFGRIVELGKADIGANKGLPLGEFERNLSFYAIDIDHMLRYRRDLFEKVIKELKGYLASGAYKAIPPIILSAENAESAFRQMTEGNHIGKFLLDFTQPIKELTFPKPSAPLVSSEKAYLVTGGTQGFGLEVAKWLSCEGANNLVLLSRSGKKSGETHELATQLTERGGTLKVLSCDVSDPTQLTQIFDRLESEPHEIGGIFHAAAVLQDAPLSDLTQEQTDQSFQAKAIGAYNLHNLTIERNISLDHFVMFSSISGMIGNAGQANYAAANVYLDALADLRHQTGLPAASIAWGSLGEVGMVARDTTVSGFLERKGIVALPISEALKNLKSIMQDNAAHTGCFNLDMDKWKLSNKQFAGSQDPISNLISDTASNAQQDTVLNRLASTPECEHEDIILSFLGDQLSTILNTKKDLIAYDKAISMLGIDSLMSIEFQLAIESNLGCPDLNVTLNIQNTVRDLAHSLLEKINELTDDASTQENIHVLEFEGLDIDNLSDEEVSLLLEEMSEATTM